MFDIGFWELVLIGIIGLLVVGPERLPGFAREVGRWIRRLRRMTSDARRELQRELQWDEDDDSRRELGDMKKQLGDMDRLMKNAPDRQPGYQPEYTSTGERRQPPAEQTPETPRDGQADADGDKPDQNKA